MGDQETGLSVLAGSAHGLHRRADLLQGRHPGGDYERPAGGARLAQQREIGERGAGHLIEGRIEGFHKIDGRFIPTGCRPVDAEFLAIAVDRREQRNRGLSLIILLLFLRALIEVLLIDSPQKPRHRPLDSFVLERRHAYRPLTPILLAEPTSARPAAPCTGRFGCVRAGREGSPPSARRTPAPLPHLSPVRYLCASADRPRVGSPRR